MLGFIKLLHVKEFLNYLNSFRGFFKTATFAVGIIKINTMNIIHESNASCVSSEAIMTMNRVNHEHEWNQSCTVSESIMYHEWSESCIMNRPNHVS